MAADSGSVLVQPASQSIYLGGRYAQALEFLCADREGPANITLLISEPGLGKTCLLRAALARVQPTSRTAFVFWTQLEPIEFLQHLLSTAGVADPAADVATAQKQFQDVLQDAARANKRFLLVIDEAQNLTTEALEKLAAVLDLGLARTRRLQVILSALPGFKSVMARPQLRRLQERVAGVVTLAPLTAKESAEYIAFHCNGANRLPDAEVARIVSSSGGVPRVIDSLCDERLRLAGDDVASELEKALAEAALHSQLPAAPLPRYAIPFEPEPPSPVLPAAIADALAPPLPPAPPAIASPPAPTRSAEARPASPPPKPAANVAADGTVKRVCDWFLDPPRTWTGTPAELAKAAGTATDGLAEHLQASADALRGFGVSASVVRRPGRPRMITLSRLPAA